MIRVNSQSFSLSSTLDRKGKNYETAQVVPKSQTFPSQTLPILHNQHSNQQRPGQGPNSPSKYQSSRIVGERDYEGDESLLLHYVTERILASVLPPRRSSSVRAMLTHSPRAGGGGGDIVAESAVVGAADDHERELIVMLEQKHGKNYRLFDLESCIATVTLEKLCELCKRIDSWLGNSREKVVVLLDRGDRQRLGAAIAAYLEYQRLCGSNFSSRATTPISGRQSVEDLQAQTTIAKKWLNLDIYSMKKFLADVVGPQRVPSHKRYLQYFSGLLSGSIKINAAPLFLKYVSMESPPSWLYYDAQSPNNGEFRCFIKVYESLHCCFTSEVYVVPITTRNFVIQIGNLRLRGDIMIRCYQLVSSPANAGAFDRELLFSVQFHTCAAGDRTLVFHRKDLDYACEDPRFPEDHKLSIQFSNGADKGYVFQSPLVRTEQQTAITQWDSLLDVNTDDQQQQHQELDDILSDMLSNVKDIPDIGRNINRSNSYYASPANTSSREHHRLGQHSQSRSSLPAQPTYHQSGRQPRSSYAYEDAYNTVKRTPSYSSSVVTDNQSIISKSSTVSSSHHPHTYLTGENYETASTTTTLTPPPSEYGGRETPSNHPYSSQRPLSRDQASSSNLYISNVERQSNQALSHPQAGYHQVRHQSQQQPNNTRSSTTTIRTTTTNEHTMDLQQQQRRDNYRAAELSREQSPGSQSVVDHHQEQNSRQQTVVYAEPQRQHTVELISATSEEDEESGQQQGIPYHAREHAQPFTYGDIAAAAAATANNSGEKSGSKGTGMLKMQSGLSSPSLVRKQIGATQHKNVPIRNEFEEMLRMRREKVENSEKYSISDRNGPENSHSGNNGHLGDNYKVSGSGGFSFDDKWASSGKLNKNGQQNGPGSVTIKTVTTTTTTRDPVGPVTANGYVHRSYEPVKRSNTMDTYNRSLSSDGASWLQKQQQRLRAKKEQLSRGSEEDYYGRTTYQENYATTSRPGRGRLNASKRYDGYTSDTTFGDEVDFRRQYAQTPPPVRNNYYNEPNRNYNTISTVTTTTKTLNNKERPFVAVRRAHEQSKQGYNSNANPLAVLNTTPHGHLAHLSPLNTKHNTMRNTKMASNEEIIVNASTIHGSQQSSPQIATNGIGMLSVDLVGESPQSPHLNGGGRSRMMREESYSSSYNGELSPSLSSRPETPAFPLTPRTPYHYGRASPALPPKSPTTQRKDLHTGQHIHHVVNQNDSMSCYTSRRNSLNSNANSEPQDVAAHHVKFVRDSSKFWYKPNITREEASSLLRHAPPGTFIVRDSKSFTNAFGLVLKVSHPPPNAAKVPPGDELVRHFLVEPTTRGVRLKGCANEPVFTSLSALVYQHSITPLALPCRLLIPDRDIQEQYDVRQYTELSQQRQLFNQGAACNVMFLCAVETESLTGPEAVKRAVSILFAKRPLPIPTEVHFKVTNQGITLTDNTRQLFFRKHYPSSQISFIAVDPDNRHWSTPVIGRDVPVVNNRVFAFVARRAPSSSDNICHIFCELEQAQPASAIVSFANNAILQITGNGSVPASPQIL